MKFVSPDIKTFCTDCVSSVPLASVAKISLSNLKKFYKTTHIYLSSAIFFTEGGDILKVEMVRRCRTELLFRVEGRYEVYAGEGSLRHRIIEHLAGRGNVFVTRHVADALRVKAKDVSNVMNRFVKRGFLLRTPYKVSLRPNCQEKIFYVRGHEGEIKDFLLGQVISDAERQLLVELIEGREIISVPKLRSEYSIMDFRYIDALIAGGFLHCKRIPLETCNGKREYLSVIYGACSDGKLEKAAEREKKWFLEHRRDGIERGNSFEDEINEFIALALKNGSLYMRAVSHSPNFYFKYPSGARGEVDNIVMFAPCVLHPKTREFVNFSYNYGGGIKLLVSIKKRAYPWAVRDVHLAKELAFQSPNVMLAAEEITGEGVLKELEKYGGALVFGKFLKVVRECLEIWRKEEGIKQPMEVG